MNVAGKPVHVVESHEEVLADWAAASARLGRPLVLLTFDRHLDTAPALSAESLDELGEDASREELANHRRCCLSRYVGAGGDEVDELVGRLQNDEHIDAALRLGVLDRALVISSQMGRSGDVPLEGVAVFRPVCAPGCVELTHDGDACARRRFDAILESELLRPALAELGFDAAAPYVVDVDLDTFSTRRGLAPGDASTFHELIRGAEVVTIAREPEYVAESLDDHGPDEIEAAILGHVRRALGDA